MTLPAFFDPIVTAPRWQKAVLGSMGLAILAVGGYFLLVSPVATRVSELRAQKMAMERELLQLRAAAANLARLKQEIAELKQALDVMKERLPTEREMPTLFRTVTDAAFQAGLQVALFQPKEPRVTDYYVEIPILVTGETGYHQLGEFFGRVAGMPRVVNVSEIKVNGAPKSKNPVKAEVTLATYHYRPAGAPPAPKPAQADGKSGGQK